MSELLDLALEAHGGLGRRHAQPHVEGHVALVPVEFQRLHCS